MVGNTMVVKHKINDKNLGPVSSFLKLRDNITILVGAFGGRILIFNLNTKKYHYKLHPAI